MKVSFICTTKNLVLLFCSFILMTPTAVMAKDDEKPQKEKKQKEKFEINGRLQTRWELTGNDTSWSDSFYIRRARIDSKWRPFEGVKLVLETELASGSKLIEGIRARDVYAEFDFLSELTLTTGYFKKPFSRLRLMSAFELPVPERGLLDNNVIRKNKHGGFGGRDLGLMLSGEYYGAELKENDPLKLEYYFGTFNNVPGDNDLYRDITGRIQFRPFKGLVFAANGTMKYYSEGGALKNALIYGGDLKWEIYDFRLQLEGSYGDNVENGSKLWGTHLITSYDIEFAKNLKLIPAVMAELYDPAVSVSDDMDFRLAAALNLDISKNIRLILAADKVWEDFSRENSGNGPVKIQLQGNLRF